MRVDLLHQHIQKGRSDVTWIKYNKNTSVVTYDQSLPNHSEIDALVASFDENDATTKSYKRKAYKTGHMDRELLIDDIVADIGLKLEEDMSTYATKMSEAMLFLDSAATFIYRFVRGTQKTSLVDYINEPNTSVVFPFLADNYEGTNTFGDHIIARLG